MVGCIKEFNMKDNNYKYTLLTGKYLPDENIKYIGSWLLFNHFNEYGQKIYSEYSDGTWVKYDYNDRGNQIYLEDSHKGIVIDER